MSVAIRMESVVKSYLMGDVEVFALRGVDLAIEPGQVLGITGPSGSGKTTLLNLLGGIDRPTAGNILVDGRNVARFSDRQLDDYRRDVVGYVFQFFNLVPTLSARENVELPMVLRGHASPKPLDRAAELLKVVGLEGRARHLPRELSGGEQQRVAIAVALANDPPILLADEPTGELDSESGQKIIELLLQVAREMKKTTLLASHDERILARCDRVVRLRDGRIAGPETPS